MPNNKTASSVIDPSSLSIVDEPYEDGRSIVKSKYDGVFGSLNPNQRLACPAGTASRIGAQLKKWLSARGEKDPVVRAKERCKDDRGGVWWIKEVPAVTVATAWKTPDTKAPKLRRAA